MIKFYGLIVLLMSCISLPAKGQKQNNVWAFGYNAGLDFNNGYPVPIKTNIAGYGEANASICDANGKLLFYTEGSNIWDRTGNLMSNGDNLTGLNSIMFFMNVTSSTTEGALIIPIPEQLDKYYVFSLTSTETGHAGRLYYSVVDMDLNGGLGDVVQDQKGIILDSNLSEKMIGIVGWHCNVWLLAHVKYPNKFKAWDITSMGINTHPIISDLNNGFYDDVGTMTVTTDGKKLTCSFMAHNSLELYDFNPGTGIVSNETTLDNRQYYGTAFSPDNIKLYASSYGYQTDSIFQFDLTNSDPAQSKTYIGTCGFTALKRAPDGKIYFFSDTGRGKNGSLLGIINFPNNAGSLCGYAQNALTLINGTYNVNAGFTNTVPVIRRDTFLTNQIIKGDCWANINPVFLQAQNDSTGWDYIWNDSSYSTNKKVDISGTYWVSYHTPPCNFNVDTFQASLPNGVLPDIHIQNSCKDFTNGKAWATTYPGDTVIYHYLWQNSNEDTLSLTDMLQHVPSGNYTLRVTTAHCDTTLFFFLPEEEHHVSFLADSIVCQGAKLYFTNTSDSSFTQFWWYFGDSGDTGLRSPGHSYKHSGSYEATLVGIGDICTDTANKTITVDSLYSGTFLTQPDSICAGQEAISFYPQTDSSVLNLHWDFDDGTEMTSNNEERIQHAYDIAGHLPVTLTTHFRACPDTSFTDTVYVYDLPKVNLGNDSSLCLNGAPILLKNLQALPPGVYYHLWNTGDTTANLKIIHPGTYSLTVSSEPLHCSTTESVKITKNCYVDIPNAFTPNGDGENDYFFPRQLLSKKITQFKMQVFNRWGQIIFETNKTDGRGWDGKFNGKPQPEGVYVYLVDAEIDGTHKEHYQGNVTLLR